MTVSCALFTLMCFTSKDEDKKNNHSVVGSVEIFLVCVKRNSIARKVGQV